jgi:threonylcarbamoyladenosine tRNA methylthiotransferase MtaB
VPERVRFQRAKELIDISRRAEAAYADSWAGKEAEVLIEGRKGQHFSGVTGNYLKVKVRGSPAGLDLTGSLVKAHIIAGGSARFLSLVE